MPTHAVVNDDGYITGSRTVPVGDRTPQHNMVTVPAPHAKAKWDFGAKVWVGPDDIEQAKIAIQAPEELWVSVRNARNEKLNSSRWTIMPDSPLTASCQGNWLGYLRKLNRITVDFKNPTDVEWPEVPTLEYNSSN